MRAHFFPLTAVSVTIGLATALHTRGRIEFAPALLALAGGLLAHGAVNVLNDWGDYRSGLDFLTRPTPFSGGSGHLTRGLATPRQFLALGFGCLAALVPIGAHFAILHGPAIIPLGLAGIALVLAYTPFLTRQPLIGLAAPGLGFGPIMVFGTYFTQTGAWGLAPFLSAMIPGSLASALLLLNQFPDRQADAAVGRRSYPIVLGTRPSSRIYGGLLATAYLAVIGGWATGLLPVHAGLALLTLPLAVRTAGGAFHWQADWEANPQPHLRLLTGNVAVVLLTPLLAAMGITLGRLF
jgi:1,4-dihydroxy-2-naphthoate octaprenyltransferase